LVINQKFRTEIIKQKKIFLVSLCSPKLMTIQFYLAKSFSHETDWNDEPKDGEGEHVEVVVAEVAVPVVDGAHRAAGFIVEPTHKAHRRRCGSQERQNPEQQQQI
jgi:hypothetical protein